ncbi:MAG: DNA/RNA non-specific endonuclease, partial [Bacteroidota bacterium]
MTKLRRNHESQRSAAGGMIARVGIFSLLAGGLFWIFNQFGGSEPAGSPAVETDPTSFEENFLPSSSTGEVIHHTYYSLSYSEAHEQAEWVAYELSKKDLLVPNVERTGDFRPDPRVRKASASTRDYSGSGYDRGHLAPAGDMAFSREAMSESFYMSNMSPQIRNFNGGAWRELEETVRDWTYEFGRLYVITGPVLSRGIREKIGDNGVSVPDEYFKVILDAESEVPKAIA